MAKTPVHGLGHTENAAFARMGFDTPARREYTVAHITTPEARESMASTKTAVIIGTGAGGLTAAAYLAQAGLRVVALEQAAETGGFLNPFKRRRYHFDPGVHYVGECKPGQAIHNVLSPLGIDMDGLFTELDPDGFDIYRFPDVELRFCKGLDRYRDRLAAAFPRHTRDIDRFYAKITAVGRAISAQEKLSNGNIAGAAVAAARNMYPLLRWAFVPYASFLNTITDDPRLRAVLSAQLGDLGLAPGRVSAIYAMGLMLHYSTGAYFPRGGSGSLRDALVAAAQTSGAAFYTKKAAATIHMKGKRALAVETEDGERFDADVVISAIEPVQTFTKLMKRTPLPPVLQWKVRRSEPSPGTFCVFLGMKRDISRHGMGRGNIWDYPHYDIESLMSPVNPDPHSGALPPMGFFLSPNSLKDDTGSMAPKGASTLEIVSMMPWEPFKRWEHMASHKRGPEYETFKAQIGEQILQQVQQRYPGLIGDVAVKEFATPVTNSYWVRAVQGGAYGPAAIPSQVGPLRFLPVTGFDNLFLAGSGTFGGGVSPCLASGRVAAKAALRHLNIRPPSKT